MKIILTKEVKGIGIKGATVEVNDGYATNYLIPHGLALVSTKDNQVQLQKDNAAETDKHNKMKEEAELLAQRLEHLNVEFKAKVGGDGKMFGSISTKEIEEGMRKQWGIVIDKRKFIDKTPANSLGYTKLRIELYKGQAGQVIGTVNVHISEDK